VTPADDDSWRVGRNERRSNAVVLDIADQVIRIIKFEGQSKDGRNRCQGYIALVPVKSDADDFLTLPRAFANDATIDKCGGIGSRLG
jgi:hypothetical protein